MKTTLDELTEKAMVLPQEQRSALADRLLSSLDTTVPPDVDEQWLDLVERRYHELKSGQVPGVPVDEMMGRLREEFGCSDS